MDIFFFNQCSDVDVERSYLFEPKASNSLVRQETDKFDIFYIMLFHASNCYVI